MLPGGSILLWGKKDRCIVCCYLAQNFTMSQRRVIKHAATKYLSPTDVEEFRTGILDAGTRLASLLTVEYPCADLVSKALYIATDVVEVYSLEGKWVTSWASGAKSEFMATSGILEVSCGVTFLV